MEEEYRIERISSGSYPHLVTLMHRCFGLRVSLDQVRAKFDTAAFGASDIGFMAFAINGDPAAYYGVFPVLVSIGGRPVLAAQSGDTMTAPEHQKKGLFVRLARMTYDLAKANDVKFIFGFPNENSLPGFERKLGWTFNGHLHDFRITTNAIPLCELSSKVTLLRPFYTWIRAHRLKEAGLEQDTPAAPGPTDGLIRDERFQNYKRSLGARWVLSNGVRFLMKADVHLYIGDIDADPNLDPGTIRKGLVSLARRCMCRTVVCTFSMGHPMFRTMSDLVEPIQSLPIGYLDLESGLSLVGMTFSRADLDTF